MLKWRPVKFILIVSNCLYSFFSKVFEFLPLITSLYYSVVSLSLSVFRWTVFVVQSGPDPHKLGPGFGLAAGGGIRRHCL